MSSPEREGPRKKIEKIVRKWEGYGDDADRVHATTDVLLRMGIKDDHGLKEVAADCYSIGGHPVGGAWERCLHACPTTETSSLPARTRTALSLCCGSLQPLQSTKAAVSDWRT